MNCRLVNNIKSDCLYNPGGITRIWLLDINDFTSYKFREDDLYPQGFVENVYASSGDVYEIDIVDESSFSESKSGDLYKQELKTFVHTLEGEKLSSLIAAESHKYVVVFSNTQGKYYTFGSDGGASVKFAQITGQVGETSGYEITIGKQSVLPLFETRENSIGYLPQYLPDWENYFICETLDMLEPDPYKRGKKDTVHIWVSNTGTYGSGFAAYDFDTMRELGANDGFQKTYNTIQIGEYEWTTDEFQAIYRGNFSWLNWTEESIAAMYSLYTQYERRLTTEQFREFNGVWCTMKDGVNSYRIPSLCEFRNKKGGHIVEGWGLPELNDIYQLIGQAPRTSKGFTADLMNFVGMSQKDAPLFYLGDGFGENISGLTLRLLGERRDMYNTTDLSIYCSRFKRVTHLGMKEGKVTFLFYGAGHSTYDNDNPTFFRQNRYCRRLTPKELGYKLVVNASLDRVWMLPFDEETALPELEPGMERGIAIRYANRANRIITKTWTDIQAEAVQLKNSIYKN